MANDDTDSDTGRTTRMKVYKSTMLSTALAVTMVPAAGFAQELTVVNMIWAISPRKGWR
jgi:hypothetical protein